ncbi:LacI family transcriptional regulator [Microlunatus phosphovorus NM-1]|uniref:LacI family transcriptional regulator n=1 Tax=Microlunatus phosphovorus (strain ATCC 700054 / DSM 10555 / JCM 9379 / NBRC 101784 / NCIMB 13414 / VKM Ac-1990 / NM-1) TaxID=1032480 RepID=F5XKY7_MICPN|nr:LacI family DNA-binding transcriptional regulator [Microlunatus phosphovorus]BAK33675.1 LacI family transcriptional regulator [Microlunatus phosphovorus NM-1]
MLRKATSQDVADLAGVSRSAVSLVLNGRGDGNIAADKQALIIEAARKLNYTPNTVALSLRSRRSATIGVVTDWIATTAFGGKLLQGASDVAAAAGYLLLVIDTQNSAERERDAFERLQNRQVDGFLFAAQSLRSYEPGDELRIAPGALANCFDPDDRVPAFLPDEVSGSKSATQHLLDCGHRDIVMLMGTPEAVAAGLRVQGFVEAMTEAGLTAPEPVVTGWDIDKGYAAAMQVLTRPDPLPTAIVGANDRSAVGVILAAAELGLSVPGDLSVVGYDDDENVAPCLVPALTTVRLPHREMGEQAMQVLLDAVLNPAPSPAAGGRGPQPRVLLDCPLVVRDSVTGPRAGR